MSGVNNRKWMAAVLAVAMIFFAGSCSSTAKEAGDNTKPGDAPVFATLAGGSPTGMLFMVCTGVSESVARSYPGSVVTIVPGSLTANAIRVNNGEVDACMANSALLYAASEGDSPYDKKLDNLAAVSNIFSGIFQIVVDKQTGITTFEEIVGKKLKVRLSFDQQGSATAVTIERLFAEYGVTREDFEAWGGTIVQKGQEDSAAMLSDGFIDGYAVQTLCPARAIQESAAARDIVLLELDPAVVSGMIEKYGYFPYTIPAGSYDFVTKDCPSLCANVVLTVPADAPDDLAYKLARSLVENIDYMREIHAGLKGLTPEGMASETGVPLHPGAMKYYKEIGVIE